jgi:hypothetical protein
MASHDFRFAPFATTKTNCAAGNTLLAIERSLVDKSGCRTRLPLDTAGGPDRNVFRIHPEVSINNTLPPLHRPEVTGLIGQVCFTN